MIKLYTKVQCPKCTPVKMLIKSVGLDVEILNTDVDNVAKEVLIEQGIMGLPVLEVDGTFITNVNEIQSKVVELAS